MVYARSTSLTSDHGDTRHRSRGIGAEKLRGHSFRVLALALSVVLQHAAEKPTTVGARPLQPLKHPVNSVLAGVLTMVM